MKIIATQRSKSPRVLVGLSILLVPQIAIAQCQFEAASVKPSESFDATKVQSGEMMGARFRIDPSRVEIGRSSLKSIIAAAYSVNAAQVSGPQWMEQELFDIVAKLPDGATKNQVPEMLRALLESRFQLKAHQATLEGSVYLLTVARGGPKLTEAQLPPGEKPTFGSGIRHGMYYIKLNAVSMSDFGRRLARYVELPVVDRTGLAGTYAIDLDLYSTTEQLASLRGMLTSAQAAQAAGSPIAVSSEAPYSVPQAVMRSVQSLGLKLIPAKGPADTIIVDSVLKVPTEN